jgi:ArsR family transcriptional regulator
MYSAIRIRAGMKMSIPPIEELELLHSNICRSIGDPRRIQILYALDEEPCHVTALAERLNVPQSTISRHLSVLRQSAMVTAERDGSTVVYSVTDSIVIEVLDMMRSLLRALLERQAIILD